jgi:DNA-binding response OmpR family regulator
MGNLIHKCKRFAAAFKFYVHINALLLVSGTCNHIFIMSMDVQCTLLIIDDEKDICVLLERLLEKSFAKVHSSHILSEGIEKAVSLHPTHILLDNNLPDGHGLQAIAVLRKLLPFVRIVMMSAVDIYREAIDAGADAFIVKPLNKQVVFRALGIQ